MTEKMICPRCGMKMNIDDGQDTLTCSNCGYQERVIINTTETSHQKEQTETSNSDELNYLSGFTGGITDVQDDQQSGSGTVVRRRKPTGLGIASFILSFTVFLSPLAVILGFLSVFLAKKRKDTSHRQGMAIAAMIIGTVLSIILISAGVSSCNEKVRSRRQAEEYSRAEETRNESRQARMEDLKWPRGFLGEIVPKPETDQGYIEWEESYGFVLYVGGMEEQAFQDYADSLYDAGFNVDYSRGKTYYMGEDKEGNQIDARYEGDGIVFIRADSKDAFDLEDSEEIYEEEDVEKELSEEEPIMRFADKDQTTEDSAPLNDNEETGIELMTAEDSGEGYEIESTTESVEETFTESQTESEIENETPPTQTSSEETLSDQAAEVMDDTSSAEQINEEPDQAIVESEAEAARQASIAESEAEAARQASIAESEAEAARQASVAESEAEAARQASIAESEAEVARQASVAESEAEAARQASVAESEAEAARQASIAESEAEAARQASIAESEAEAARQASIAASEAEAARQAEEAAQRAAIPAQVTYVGNANSKKFHAAGCSSIDRMAEYNKVFFYGDRNEPISLGYEPCKNCNP